jgi:hypothetical protein
MIRNLGRVLTILALADASEHEKHSDISMFGAPGECHALASRGEVQRKRTARRHAEAEARRHYHIIRREAFRRGCPIGSPRYDGLVGRCMTLPE